MKNYTSKFFKSFTIFVFALLICCPQFSLANDNPVSKNNPNGEVPKDVLNGINHLLTLVAQKGQPFDAKRVGPILDFVVSDQHNYGNVKPKQRDSGKGVFMRINVQAPLKRMLQYIYNPEIPNYIIFPSVLRLCGWLPDSEFVNSGVKVWDELDRLNDPLILRGREFEVNTPDSFSGAYYRYVNKRLVVVMKHGKGRALISGSKMLTKSDVGKKAVIIDDYNWNYFYSGIKGLNLNLIGAMNTYMYDAESVIIYYQPDLSSPRTVVALFKWLRAGWAGINVVKPDHIYDGCIRFAQGIKKVMESNTLPEPKRFSEQVNYIYSLSDDQIDDKIREYALNFEQIAKSHKGMSKKEYVQIIANGGYADVLDREERIGALILELLKQQIGKPALVNFKLSNMTPKSRTTSPISDLTRMPKNPDDVPRVSLRDDSHASNLLN